jgi:hypothetical protein
VLSQCLRLSPPMEENLCDRFSYLSTNLVIIPFLLQLEISFYLLVLVWL